MALYEHIFMARQDVSSQQVDTLVEHFKGVLEANGGSVGKIENWGLKTLPYRVNKNRKAHYALMNIDAPSAAVAEMERQMRLHEDVLRYMTIRVEEHEEGPSAMLRKSDRDDRRPPRGGDRGDRPDRGERRPREDAPAAE
ncbi:30S ribosomal protein S6 [Pseudahrensia aquimaris]|uniref:Small ribosomal subunit protein bS6 n=1 Tax=Pseudahrensia aquimaris TaxID=744461 RepID=A0ABW3FB90_9HYPH